jgi:hypothetical protein
MVGNPSRTSAATSRVRLDANAIIDSSNQTSGNIGIRFGVKHGKCKAGTYWLLWTLLAAVAAGIAALIRARGDAMEGAGNVKILFVAGFGPIVRDKGENRKLYPEVLDIQFREESGGYLHTEALQGAKTLALWPLSQAAQSCFGKDRWPDGIPVPQAWLGFDVDNVEEATGELESRGYRMLIKNKKEPWVKRSRASSRQKDCWLVSLSLHCCGKRNRRVLKSDGCVLQLVLRGPCR